MLKKSYKSLDYGEVDSIGLFQTLLNAQYKIATEYPPSEGKLRGGSTGAIIDNEVYGECHRKAWLRFQGISDPLDANIELMTKQGEQNEQIWLAELRKALPHPYVAKFQDEFECLWAIDGVPGSGSPDIVIWNTETDKPVLGLELKNLSKASSAIGAHHEYKPSTKYLIQTANYALRMGDMYLGGRPLPYLLMFSNRVIHQMYTIGEAAKKKIAMAGWTDVEFKWGKPANLMPFHRAYSIDWEPDGTMKYWTPGMKSWARTKLTRESIDNYYRAVGTRISKDNNLGPRPTSNHIDGSKAYPPCNFCDLQPICDQFEHLSVTEFKDHAQQFAAERWVERKSETSNELD